MVLPSRWAQRLIELQKPVKKNQSLTPVAVLVAPTDGATIRKWWDATPYADPAWAVPADIVVVDLDCKHGANGLRDFRDHEGGPGPDADRHDAKRRTAPDDRFMKPLNRLVGPPAGAWCPFRASQVISNFGSARLYAANGAPYRNGVRINGSAIDLRNRWRIRRIARPTEWARVAEAAPHRGRPTSPYGCPQLGLSRRRPRLPFCHSAGGPLLHIASSHGELTGTM